MSTYFTADLHLGHARILELCKRPFANVEHMDAALIGMWNRLVQPKDVVYVLGDFSFQPERYLALLRGRKILLRGNHDPARLRPSPDGFEAIEDVLMWRENKKQIWLSHYPHRVWPAMHHGARHLYGHVHGETQIPVRGSLDAGVDATGFRLLTPAEIFAQVPEPTLADLQAELKRTNGGS